MKNQRQDLGVINVAEILERYLDRQELDKYFSVLMEHNSRVNLVSRETSRDKFDRLVAESLLPLDQLVLPVDGYLDIGSGGGFPSLSILLSGLISEGGVMVERTGKKAQALRSMLTELGLKGPSGPPESRGSQRSSPGATCYSPPCEARYTSPYRIRGLLRPTAVLVYYSRPEFPMPRFQLLRLSFIVPCNTKSPRALLFSKSKSYVSRFFPCVYPPVGVQSAQDFP